MMQVGARIGARRLAGACLVERARIVGVARVAQIDRAVAREGDARGGRCASAARSRTCRCRARPLRAGPPACRRPSDSAACRPAARARPRRPSAASPPAARRPQARRSRSRESRCRRARARSRRAAPRSSPPCTMPNSARPGAAPSKARLQRSAQRSDSRIARSISARVAGSFRHSSSCITMSAPSRFWISTARSGVSATIAPSICERNVTPRSSSLRSCDSDMTWKPPESVRIGCGQFMKRCKPPSARDALRARPQHQVIGVAEQDVGAGGAHGRRVHALHGRLRADRHEGGRAHDAVRGRDLAGARGAVGRDEPKAEMLAMRGRFSGREPYHDFGARKG